MLINLIAAVDRDWVIGADGTMPWPRQKEDMADFKSKTTGHAVIMGRKTAESIGRPLEKRFNLVLTRGLKKPFVDSRAEGFWLANDLLDAITMAQTQGFDTAWIIGGADIYTQAMQNNLVDNVYINHLPLHADVVNHETGQDYFEYTYFPKDLLLTKYRVDGTRYSDKTMRLWDDNGMRRADGIMYAHYVPRQRRLFA